MNVAQKRSVGRPPRAASDREAGRQALVATAFDLLREGGPAALTARAVAARAGTAVGSVYTAFESLEALRLEANAITMGLLRDRLARALAGCGTGSVEKRLLCLADAYIGFSEEHRSLWLALFEPRTAPVPPVTEAVISGLFVPLEQVLRDAGCADAHDVPVLSRALWSSVHGMVYLAANGSLGPVGREDAPAMVHALVRAVAVGLDAQGGQSNA